MQITSAISSTVELGHRFSQWSGGDRKTFTLTPWPWKYHRRHADMAASKCDKFH